MVQRFKSAVYSGIDKRETLAHLAKQRETLVANVAKGGSKRVVMNQGGGESGGDDVEGVVISGFADVYTEVTEGDTEVGVIV